MRPDDAGCEEAEQGALKEEHRKIDCVVGLQKEIKIERGETQEMKTSKRAAMQDWKANVQGLAPRSGCR